MTFPSVQALSNELGDAGVFDQAEARRRDLAQRLFASGLTTTDLEDLIVHASYADSPGAVLTKILNEDWRADLVKIRAKARRTEGKPKKETWSEIQTKNDRETFEMRCRSNNNTPDQQKAEDRRRVLYIRVEDGYSPEVVAAERGATIDEVMAAVREFARQYNRDPELILDQWDPVKRQERLKKYLAWSKKKGAVTRDALTGVAKPVDDDAMSDVKARTIYLLAGGRLPLEQWRSRGSPLDPRAEEKMPQP